LVARAVHEDRDVGDAPGCLERVQVVQQQLRAPDRERGDQHRAVALGRAVDEVRDALGDVGVVVEPVAVR